MMVNRTQTMMVKQIMATTRSGPLLHSSSISVPSCLLRPCCPSECCRPGRGRFPSCPWILLPWGLSYQAWLGPFLSLKVFGSLVRRGSFDSSSSSSGGEVSSLWLGMVSTAIFHASPMGEASGTASLFVFAVVGVFAAAQIGAVGDDVSSVIVVGDAVNHV